MANEIIVKVTAQKQIKKRKSQKAAVGITVTFVIITVLYFDRHRTKLSLGSSKAMEE